MGVERNVMRCAVSGALAVVSAWATASGADLSVVGRDGGFAVERDGKAVVTSVRYDCGAVLE